MILSIDGISNPAHGGLTDCMQPAEIKLFMLEIPVLSTGIFYTGKEPAFGSDFAEERDKPRNCKGNLKIVILYDKLLSIH